MTDPDRFEDLDRLLANYEEQIQSGGNSDLHMDLACHLWNRLESWFEAGLLPPELVVPESWLRPSKRGKPNMFLLKEGEVFNPVPHIVKPK